MCIYHSDKETLFLVKYYQVDTFISHKNDHNNPHNNIINLMNIKKKFQRYWWQYFMSFIEPQNQGIWITIHKFKIHSSLISNNMNLYRIIVTILCFVYPLCLATVYSLSWVVAGLFIPWKYIVVYISRLKVSNLKL